jgi:hypothetical protein
MKKIKPVDLSGEISDLSRKTAVFAGKQAVSAPYFRAPSEKGTGIPPSGKSPAPAQQIRTAKQHIQPAVVVVYVFPPVDPSAKLNEPRGKYICGISPMYHTTNI